jgi:hypothetical protein
MLAARLTLKSHPMSQKTSWGDASTQSVARVEFRKQPDGLGGYKYQLSVPGALDGSVPEHIGVPSAIQEETRSLSHILFENLQGWITRALERGNGCRPHPFHFFMVSST